MANKKLNVVGIIFTVVIAIGFILILTLKANNQTTDKKSKIEVASYYEVSYDEALKIKGRSIVSSEQNITFDNTSQEMFELKVKNEDLVASGQVLYTYTNISVKAELEDVKKNIAGIAKKTDKVKEELKKCVEKLDVAEEEEKEQINLVKNSKNDELSQLKESLSELEKQKADLNNKLKVNVTANINGTVIIDDEGLKNPAGIYMKVLSDVPCVRCEVTEFDLKSINVGNTMKIKVLSTGEVVEGTISSISKLPVSEENDLNRYSTYYVYLLPKQNIPVGFTVQATLIENSLEIPKEYVYVENEKLYVFKKVNGVSEKVEIQAILDGDYYILQDQSVLEGDKLISNPLENE